MKHIIILLFSLTGWMAGVLAQGVTQGEYFWGNADPGAGNGVALTAPEGNFGNAIQAVLANAVPITSEGPALFNLRVREQAGGWGPVFSVVVNGDAPFVTNREIMVTQAEYFWGSDPGEGAGMPMFTLDGNFDNAIETIVNTAIEVAEEPTVEVLSIRVRDAENVWGLVFSVVVSIEPAITTSREIKVSAAEYYFNDDPGAGNGTAMLAVNGNFNNAIKALKGGNIPAPIEAGIHVLWMRARDAENAWGPPFGVVVNMDTTITGLNAQINGQLDFCMGDNLLGINYSTPATGGSTYVWTATNGAVVSGQGGPNVNVNWNPSGNRTLTLTQCLGTDCETETITISVHPTYEFTDEATICEGQSIFLGGANQTQSGAYSDTYQSINGCDSVIVTTLSVVDAIEVFLAETICAGESLFVGGANQTTSGNYVDEFVSVSGCDSLVTTNLTVLDPILVNESAQVCQGGSILIGGELQSTPGNYTEVFESVQGCDSVVVTNLSIIPAPIIEESVEICPGQSYFVGGAEQTEPGEYSDIITDGDGCQTVVITTLSIESSVIVNESATICQGQSIFLGGADQTIGGVYTDIETDGDGCEITILTTLTVSPPTVVEEIAEICEGQSIFLGGANQTEPGVYTDIISDLNGCDVIIETTLSIVDQIQVSVNAAICPGDSLFVGGGWQNIPGDYTDVFDTEAGCDSIVVTNLSLLPAISIELDEAICQGDSLFVGGAYQYEAGSYFDSFTTEEGCDSLVTTNLTLHPAPAPNIDFTGGVLTTGQATSYQWYFNGMIINGANNQFLVPDAQGSYSVVVTNAQGCTGESEPFAYVVDSVSEVGVLSGFNVYPNPGTGLYFVDRSATQDAVLNIFDLTGRMVDALIRRTENGWAVDLSSQASGTYLFVVRSESEIERKRVMLTR